MAIQTSPNSKPGSLFFTDARTCKEWLKSIPLTNIAQAQQNILDALRILNRSPDFVALERLTCMELLRDKVAFLLSEQRARYAGKTIPLSHGDNAAWMISRTLLTEMESGYRRCWTDAAGEESPLVAHAALIVQRIMRYIGLQMLIAGFIYRRFDPALWMRLHLQWMEAESRGLATRKVKDSIGSLDGYSTVLQAFTAVLLGQSANIYELTPRQIDFVDAVLKRFGHKVTIGTEAAPNPHGMICAVDLLSNAGCAFRANLEPAEHVRMLQLEDLSRSLRRRIKKLADGEDPATMDLPAEWSPADAREQLVRLHRVWCEGTSGRPPATIPDEKEAQLTFGISETHFFMSGDLFEQPDVKRELTRQEMNDITMFGKVSESTVRARYAEFNYGTEKWGIVDESRGYLRLLRPANSSHGVAIGKLVGVKIGKQDAFYLGAVRELSEELDGMIYATLAMLPGKPEATSVRSSDNRNRGGGHYVQGFRLPAMEALKIPETLVVPASFAQKGRGIDIFLPAHGSPKMVKLLDFVERGVDFDRVTIG
jgi:cyclic-di-GMP-binding protein